MDESTKVVKVNDLKIECIERYGYNDHYYVTLYDDTEGNCDYLGQLEDCRLSHKNLEKRVKDYVNENVF